MPRGAWQGEAAREAQVSLLRMESPALFSWALVAYFGLRLRGKTNEARVPAVQNVPHLRGITPEACGPVAGASPCEILTGR